MFGSFEVSWPSLLSIKSASQANRVSRCLSAHPRPDLQNLFPIVQGGLEEEKRKDCADQVRPSLMTFKISLLPSAQQLMKRDVPGFAVGGLSGGEAKEQFWRCVELNFNRRRQ